ncbi:dehydration-responsive element-binding protein 3-like [Rutidosis leptorrhynchoides]|uniref:dehydration-responsive element-binding protein 3-like n=1 Tax=Rutidosis leptorrhynchoides TaxID=125765 RepID=UPI003A98E91F
MAGNTLHYWITKTRNKGITKDEDVEIASRTKQNITSNSAVLNFPELKDTLPRPVSLSRRDVQEAAAKAATMQMAAAPLQPPGVVDLKTTEELGEIIELPNLEGCLDSPKSSTELVMVDSVDLWVYPSWSMAGIDCFLDYISDPVADNAFLWDC